MKDGSQNTNMREIPNFSEPGKFFALNDNNTTVFMISNDNNY